MAPWHAVICQGPAWYLVTLEAADIITWYTVIIQIVSAVALNAEQCSIDGGALWMVSGHC